MAQTDFAGQLRALGFAVEDMGNGRLCFEYLPPLGRLAGQRFRIGYEAPGDFPLTPPPGPHVSPRVHPNQSGGEHPTGGIHDSPFGADWQYWSRPMQHWPETSRSARDVIAHLHHLFESQ